MTGRVKSQTAIRIAAKPQWSLTGVSRVTQSRRARIERVDRTAVDWDFTTQLHRRDAREHARKFAPLDRTSPRGEPAYRDARPGCDRPRRVRHGCVSVHNALTSACRGEHAGSKTKVTVSHPEKILYAGGKFTKADVVEAGGPNQFY
jgi:hypothetical protein